MRTGFSSAGFRMMMLVAGVAFLAATVVSTANAQDGEDTPEPEVVYLYDHVPDKDIDLTTARSNPRAYGMWASRDTIYVADYFADKAFAFNVDETSYGTYDSSSTINLGNAQWTVATPPHWREREITANLDRPGGIWANGMHMWVSAESTSTKSVDLLEGIWKIDMSTGQATGFWSLHSDNTVPGGIWSNAETIMWVLDRNDNKVYAYSIEDGTRQTSKEFSLAFANQDAVGLWSDYDTMWVTDYQDKYVYAYTLSTGRMDSSKSFSLHADNANASGLWSDDTTMWVADSVDDKLYAYSMTGERRTGGI